MTTFLKLLLPLSGLVVGAGALVGGRFGEALLIIGTAGFGVACVLVFA